MNTEDKSEISELLAEVREALNSAQKVQSELSKLETAFDKLRHEIAALGEPAFDEMEKIEKLSMLQKQRDVCQRRIETLEGGLGAFRVKMMPLWRRFAPIAVGLLDPVFRRCCETVTAALKPFFPNEADASIMANQTPAVLQVANGVRYYTSGLATCFSTASTAAEAALKMEAILAEAQKEYPDFLQFLAPKGFALAGGSTGRETRRLGRGRVHELAAPAVEIEGEQA